MPKSRIKELQALTELAVPLIYISHSFENPISKYHLSTAFKTCAIAPSSALRGVFISSFLFKKHQNGKYLKSTLFRGIMPHIALYVAFS